MGKSKVAVLRVKPESILDDISRLMDLAGFRKHLDPQKTVILKDNISWHYPFPSANTTPWQLEGTIKTLQSSGYGQLVCVQNKTEVTNAFKGEELNRYSPIFKKYGIGVLFNFHPEDMEWVVFHPKTRMRVLNKIYGDKIMIPDYFIGKNIMHLPTAKCHIYTTTTGAMKNAFGGLLNHKRHQTHTHIHETLVDLLAIQKEIHSGIFCVMDATTAGNGPGPRVMHPVEKNIMLASADQVAIDAVAAKMMGFEPMKIGYIRMAHDDGLGTGRFEEIEIVGDQEASRENWGFRVGMSFHKFAGWFTWFGPTRFLQKLLTRPPLLYLGNFYSYFYHDVIHWPFIQGKLYRRWLKNSRWGRLFGSYPEK
jgi:uncharacterized protein (DUF362 family)